MKKIIQILFNVLLFSYSAIATDTANFGNILVTNTITFSGNGTNTTLTANNIATIQNSATNAYTTGFVIGGADAPVTTGSKGFFRVVTSGTITKWVMRTDVTTTSVLDIAKCSPSDYPVTTSIVASAPPTLSNQKCVTNTTLSGWTTSLLSGDYIKYSFTSNTSATNIAFELTITP